MSEPDLLTSATGAAQQESLWHRAPAWRNLTITATIMTFAALVSLQLLAPQADSPVQVAAGPAAAAAELPTDQPPPAAQHPLVQAPEPSQQTTSVPLPAAPARHDAIVPQERMASVNAPAMPAQAAEPSDSCPITLSPQAQPMGGGVVVGFEGVLAAQRRAAGNERSIGGPINPAFANTPRAIVRMDGSETGATGQIAVLPPGMTVNIGDHVTFDGIHRDLTMPCGFVPPLVTADNGPAQPGDNLQAGPNAQAAPQ